VAEFSPNFITLDDTGFRSLILVPKMYSSNTFSSKLVQVALLMEEHSIYPENNFPPSGTLISSNSAIELSETALGRSFLQLSKISSLGGDLQ